MHRRARDREEFIADFELRAAASVIENAYMEDSDGDMFEEASMIAFCVRDLRSSNPSARTGLGGTTSTSSPWTRPTSRRLFGLSAVVSSRSQGGWTSPWMRGATPRTTPRRRCKRASLIILSSPLRAGMPQEWYYLVADAGYEMAA